MADPHSEDADGLALTLTAGTRRDVARSTGAAPSDARPEMVGRYRIDGELGAGGMGVVLRGYDVALNRPVAVKLLHSPLLDGKSQRALRLVREAQAAARLSHPNVVSVYEVGADERGPFIAMEYVEGVTVSAWLRAEKPGWRRILDAYLQAGRGLAAAHAVGLIHRDMKPDNILVGQDRVRVADFGIARPAGAPIEGSGLAPDAAASSTITNTGTVLGTPKYMAPEQREGGGCDERSDQYSFCLSLYESLHGCMPDEATEQSRNDVPSWLEAALSRGLSVEPAARFESMEALLAALEPPRSRRWGLGLALGVAGGATAAVIALLVVGGGAADRCATAGASIDEVWNQTEQTRIERAILATGRSYARTTYEHLRVKLDRYARAWRASREQSCRMSRDNPAREARERCLERQLDRMRKVIAALREADGKTVDRAILAVTATLRQECSDLTALSKAQLPPEDPAKRERIRAAESEADDIALAARTGHTKGLYERVQKLVKEARALGYAPLLVYSLQRRVEIEGQLRRPLAEQQKTLRDLIREASAAHDDFEVARAWTRLIIAMGRSKGGVPAALEMRTAAESAVARAGNDPRLRAELAHALGLVFRHAGRAAESVAQLELSVELAEKHLGPDHPNLAASLVNLAMSYLRRGEAERAHRMLLRAATIRTKIFGEGHPSLIPTYANLAAVLRKLGKLDEAVRYDERSLALVRRTMGPEHPRVAQGLQNLGLVFEDQGKLDRAERAYREALAIYNKQGKETKGTADVYTVLGLLDRKRGRPDKTLAHCTRAAKLYEASWPNALRRGTALVCVAKAQLMLHRPAAAVEPAERGLAERRKLGLDPGMISDAEYTLARALWSSRRDRARALKLARSAVKLATIAENRAEIKAWLQKRSR